MGRGRAAAIAVVGVFVLGIGTPSALPQTRASAPVIMSWSIGAGPAGCDCIDFEVQLTSDSPTAMRVEWGTTAALGAVAGNAPVPIGTGVWFTLRWLGRPDPGTYYARLVAENTDGGSTATGAFVFAIGTDGSVRMVPTFPPPPPLPVAPRAALTLASTAPITVVVGDTVDITAIVSTNATWGPSMQPSVWFTLPGLTGTCIGCILDAVDLVSATPTSGTCEYLLTCDFGAIGSNAHGSVTVRLRGKTPGAYEIAVHASYSSAAPTKIPFTVVARVADLSVSPAAPAARVLVGKTATRTITIANRGPHSVSDATLIVGWPRGVTVRAVSADGSCTTAAPIRCILKELASGATATVTVTVAAKRAGRTSIPIGVGSRLAGDPATADNASHFVLTAIGQPTKQHRR